MDTIDGMRVFAAVIEAGGFSAAARRLGMSKALTSKYVAQLEERLGARLINRTTRRLNATEVGTAYYDRCIRILGEIDELEEAVANQHGAPRGLLRVAAARAFGEDMLVDAVADFMTAFPDITVELMLDERQVDIVGEGFDMAVRLAALEDSAMIARRIAAYPFVVCASPEFLSRAGTPSTPQALSRADCIVNAAISPTGQWQFVLNGEPASVTVRARATVNTARATATLVRRGLGIGVCLYSTVREDLAAGRVVRLFKENEAYDRSVYALYPHGRHLSAKVRLFVDHLVETFRGYRDLPV